MADLRVNVAGVEFKNPVIPASGAFGYGREYEKFYPLSKFYSGSRRLRQRIKKGEGKALSLSFSLISEPVRRPSGCPSWEP